MKVPDFDTPAEFRHFSRQPKRPGHIESRPEPTCGLLHRTCVPANGTNRAP